VRLARILFWASSAAIAHTHVGYPAVLWALARVRTAGPGRRTAGPEKLPSVSLVTAARNEESVIARKIANARALDYPRDRLELIVSVNDSSDGTAAAARAAAADVVLERDQAGKVRAQDAAVERATGEIVFFSDANSTLEPDALRNLVRRFEDAEVGYACGQVSFVRGDDGGDNQEGLYWRYETGVRELESRLGSITAGNGAIYATRREAYLVVDERMGHDLSFPFNMVKRGWRAVYEPSARAVEKMTPTNEDEFARKRRMMSHTWPIVLTGGLLSPRGYPPLYAFEVASHRLLRYVTPFLHAVALASNLALLRRGGVYRLALAAQAALLAAALVPLGPLRVARYYVLVTASSALGLWDWLTKGTPAGWDQAEGTR
jgi:cellulose synthase/poly-beta-1,6-N-acetylglucosamine synthase-like glycosyltransferase